MRQIAAEVVVLRRGRVVEEGPADAVFARPEHPYTRELLEAVPIPDPSRARAEGRAQPGPDGGLGLSPAPSPSACRSPPPRPKPRSVTPCVSVSTAPRCPSAVRNGPIGSLEYGHELGMSGLFYRTVLDMSPTLDRGELRAIRERADELGMYVESGLGKVNPYANPEAPELRALGDGDILLGFRQMMEACAEIGCLELWSALANYKWMFRGKHAYDRFRTDVDWADQLAASAKFLKRLAPIARDLGIHINIETHEEVTSFELVRLVEEVGPDVTGIVYDTSNPLQRLEHPVWTARRVAPYTRQTHCKDGMLGYGGGGVDYQHRPIGTGVVDYHQILPILAAANPGLNLSIEPPQSVEDADRARLGAVDRRVRRGVHRRPPRRERA